MDTYITVWSWVTVKRGETEISYLADAILPKHLGPKKTTDRVQTYPRGMMSAGALSVESSRAGGRM